MMIFDKVVFDEEVQISEEEIISDDQADVLGDLSSSEGDSVSVQDISVTVDFPDDYLDVDTFNLGIDYIADILIPDLDDVDVLPEGVEELSVMPLAAVGSAYGLDIPDNRVVYYLNDSIQLVFPDEAAGHLEIVNGYLVNLSDSNIVGNAVLSGSGQSTYYMSTITLPPYGSTTYATYVYNYGYPYMIQDAYRYYQNGAYSLRTQTRSSSSVLGTGTLSPAPWLGFSGRYMYGFIFYLLVVVLLIWRLFKWNR